MAVKARLTSQTTVSFSGIDANILLGGADSPFTVMLLRVQPGHGAPNHISEFEDKLFKVDSGRFRFIVEDEVLDVETGDHVFARKGAVHGFAAIDSVSMLTLVSTPSGHEKFFEDLSRLPTPHTPEAVSAVSEANQTTYRWACGFGLIDFMELNKIRCYEVCVRTSDFERWFIGSEKELNP